MPVSEKFEKVQSLLNVAESHRSLGELDAAEMYQKQADRLITQYRITEAQLGQAKMAKGLHDVPDVRNVIFAGSADNMLNEYYSIYNDVARHNGCMFQGYYNGTGVLVGYEDGMEATELMFAIIRQQLVSKVSPEADVTRSFDHNVYTLHEAGIKWEVIAQMLDRAYVAALPDGVADDKWIQINWTKDKKDGGRLIRAAKRYAKNEELEYHTVMTPDVYRRSYAAGFSSEIWRRLHDLKEYQEQQISEVGGAAVAILGRDDRVKARFLELFPPREPAKTSTGKAKKSTYKFPRTDYSAYDRGSNAGQVADLGTSSNKEIGG